MNMDRIMTHATVLITAPTQDVIELDDAKAQLRITGPDQDDLIDAMVQAAVGEFDPAAGGWLGRAFRPQTWEYRIPSFYGVSFHGAYPAEVALRGGCSAAIALPYAPIITVDSVKYYDTNGTDTTLAPSTGYRIMNSGGLGKQSIAPPYGQAWPNCRVDQESVRIRFTAGYDSTTTDTLPAAIKQAIHLAVRNIYSLGERSMFQSMKNIAGVSETRWVVSSAGSEVIRTAVEDMLSPYRIW